MYMMIFSDELPIHYFLESFTGFIHVPFQNHGIIGRSTFRVTNKCFNTDLN